MLKEIVTLHCVVEGQGGSVRLATGQFKRTARLLIRCEPGLTAQRIELGGPAGDLRGEWQYTPDAALRHYETQALRKRDYAQRELATQTAVLEGIAALRIALMGAAGMDEVASRIGDTAPATAAADDHGTSE